MTTEQAKAALEAMIRDGIAIAGSDIEASYADVSAYAAERATHLAGIVGSAGYLEALQAEADSLAIEAGIEVVDLADAQHQRLIGMFQGGLQIVAGLLVEEAGEAA